MEKYKFSVDTYQRYYSYRLNGISFDSEFLSIENCLMTIKATKEREFKWDGCSPKFKIFGFFIGTPDFKGTYRGSMFHDALFTYKPCSFDVANLIFLDLMSSDKFYIKSIYYKIVHWFGLKFWNKNQ